MSRVPSRVGWLRRVYTIVALAISCSLTTGEARGQANLTAAPSMVKGASAARVTIVEFSDYQ